MSRRIFFVLIALLFWFTGGVGAADDYPGYPVQFIISFPPGGPGDTTIRIVHPTRPPAVSSLS